MRIHNLEIKISIAALNMHTKTVFRIYNGKRRQFTLHEKRRQFIYKRRQFTLHKKRRQFIYKRREDNSLYMRREDNSLFICNSVTSMFVNMALVKYCVCKIFMRHYLLYTPITCMFVSVISTPCTKCSPNNYWEFTILK